MAELSTIELPTIELPTIEKILENRNVIGELKKAWINSFTTKKHCREHGGFIYMEFTGPKPEDYILRAVRTAPGESHPQDDPEGSNMAIDLNNLPREKKNRILVANFHTHPLHSDVRGNPYPSLADRENAYFRKIPGLVISRKGFIKYGISNRIDRRDPEKYPPAPPGPAPYVPYTLLPKPKPFGRAPKQWEPGASVQWFEEDHNEEESALESENGGNEDDD